MDSDIIKSLIEEFLEKLTIDYDRVEVARSSARTAQFQIESRDSRLLIGREGSGLDALNHLLRQLARRRFSTDSDQQTSFFVDVNRYRARRMEEIVRSAEAFAERARVFKRDVELPPATAFERMVVHAHFADDPDLLTESYGEGKFRRVVLKRRQEYIDG